MFATIKPFLRKKLVGNSETRTDMYAKGEKFAAGTEKKDGEERRNKSSVGRMLEYKMFLRHTRNFLKRMTLRLPKSVDKVSNCLILNVVTNTTLNHIIEFTTKKKNLRNQHGLWLFGRSGRWQAKIYNTGNYKSLLRLR